MNDMSPAIVPKSDQLNTDDLLAGPRTIRITAVSIRPGTEQPVSISFEGDGGKPYKPCKSMCRVMVHAWGADASKYIGRSLTLYADPKVTWGGMAVGGIRISHMSDIDGKITMALTVTKNNKRPFTVVPLVSEAAPAAAPTPAKKSVAQWLDDLEAEIDATTEPRLVSEILERPDVVKATTALKGDAHARLTQLIAKAQAREFGDIGEGAET